MENKLVEFTLHLVVLILLIYIVCVSNSTPSHKRHAVGTTQ